MARLRIGFSSDSTPFRGVPDLVSDTIANVAHSLKDVALLRFEALAPRYNLALEHNRETLLGLLAALTQRLPDDADVFEALARVLEMRDDITGTPNGGHSALSALERAKTLATDTTQRTRIGASEVRLHLKLGDFSRSVALGDSILAASPRATGATASFLVGIAALLGRERDAVRYMRASGLSVRIGPGPEIPVIEDVATALFMRTALGVCDDSVRLLQRRLGALLESYVGPAQLPQARYSLIQRPLAFAVGCLGPAATLTFGAPLMGVLRIDQALGRGNLAGARAQLDSVQRSRSSLRPGEFALDVTIAEAWARVAIGDTAAAIRQLDLTLTALPTLTAHIIVEPGMAAAVGRSMAYRADLAAGAGDRASAALWAGRVLTLWAHADRSLEPTMARMKRLAAGRTS
jgi:hypothetical protein